MNTYEVTLVKIETRYRTATVMVTAENDDDARVLAKYEKIYSYDWKEDLSQHTETQSTTEVRLVETPEVTA